MIERDLCSSYTSYRCTGDVTEWTWSVLIPLEHQRDKRWKFPKISKENSMLYVSFFCRLIKSYKYKKRDWILVKVIEKQASISKAPDVSRMIAESVSTID